jgi:hypothetical protein
VETESRLLNEFVKLRNGDISLPELERASAALLGKSALRHEDPWMVLEEIGDAWIFGALTDLEHFESDVRRTTIDEILEDASEWLDPERRVEGVVLGLARQFS